MKKTLIITLALSILTVAGAQVKKCGIDTRALVAEEIAAGNTTVNMLAKMVPGYDRSVFEKAGIVIGAEAGQIVTMRVPVSQLGLLESSKDVIQYSISHHIAAPTCNNNRVDTRTDSVQNGWGVEGDTSFDGAGVYIGITDWGFDYQHINYNGYGVSNWRLDKAWDHFRLAGPAPAGFNYGTEITGHADLVAAQCDTSNLYGYGTHGTHVAGIAGGRGVNGNYKGQAPGAKLLFCSFGLGESEWMDGVAWMKRVAEDSARRLVVNSSWGMYSFSCLDGRSLLSQAIDAWSDEGVVFCTSAGNNGDVDFHISRTFTPEVRDTMKTVATYFRSDECVGQVLILWGEKGHDFEACFRMQDGDNVWTSPMYNTADGDMVVYDTLMCGTTAVPYRVLMEHMNPFDSLPHIQMDVDKGAELQLFFTAESGTVHAWNVANKKNHAGNEGCEFSNGGHAGFHTGNHFYGIGEPACSAKTISVAAHVADYWNPDTTVYTTGGLTYFSSYGPLINSDRQKPEVSAPGSNVVSSISCYTTGSYSPYMTKTLAGKTYIWSSMSGTSMSSPAVTGVVALMLQANPLITTEQVRDILTRTARNDDHTGPLHERDSASIRWGWGKVDALKAVNEAMRLVSIDDVESMRLPLHVYPNPATGMVRVLTGCGEPLTLEAYSIDGRKVYADRVDGETSIDVSRWAKGVYVLRAGSRTEKLIVR